MSNEEVFLELRNWLNSISSLSSFYIGKSDDVERRSAQHWYKEGYEATFELAKSTAGRIKELEKYLIEKFQKSDLVDKCENKRIGGGSNESDCLYISLRFKPNTIDELDDDDNVWKCFQL